MTVTTERVRGYELLEQIGQDGPWAVHRARRTSAGGGEVLLKTLTCRRVDKRALKRIMRGLAFPEELAAHPGVIPVLEVGATGDGRPYLVTPPHEGLTLAERPGRGRPMPLEQATGLLRAVARVVAATHAVGGAHGRVKPENVVMTAGGVVLTGFAMSALMSIVELPDGTPPSVHASPEELEGHPPVPASDVYALGSMAYELLAGRPAFPLDGPGSTARFVLGVLTETPPPLPSSVPPDLARVLSKAMSKNPAARPTADELAAAARTSTRGPDVSGPRLSPAGTTAAHLPPTDISHPSTPLPPTGRPAPQLATAGPEPRLPAAGPAPQEGSGARELVWTVDPDRSQVRPPAGPRPFLPPAPEAAPHPAAPQQAAKKGSKVPLLVAGVSALAVLVGVGSVALAMRGAVNTTTTAQNQAADTQPGDGAANTTGDQGGDGATDGTGHRTGDGAADTTGDQADTPTGAPTAADQNPQPSVAPTASADPTASSGVTTSPGSATSPPTATLRATNPATVAAYRPKSLKLVSDNGATVTLSWKAVRKNDYPTIIQQSPGDRLMTAPSGSTTYTVGGLDAASGYCFKVGTVVTLGQPSSVAWSSALCIRGAAETGQDDEVQPPIVLPLATPPTAPPEQG
ncbi:protein kinase [Nonomuraea sp. FMUSA5-5]|uniref:non-specific serine/threonine protein kinase n=1 Tax=Nonomuraea composti TaxID=2720023 RepID=A0ABX1BDC3_9ACTN|nr:serine/threonine-protein kinase [Nonomuraea sp. FMUSA5-5]NJP95783.1 protein kinase [Nonomuraea sp. FMUSA5-5]